MSLMNDQNLLKFILDVIPIINYQSRFSKTIQQNKSKQTKIAKDRFRHMTTLVKEVNLEESDSSLTKKLWDDIKNEIDKVTKVGETSDNSIKKDEIDKEEKVEKTSDKSIKKDEIEKNQSSDKDKKSTKSYSNKELKVKSIDKKKEGIDIKQMEDLKDAKISDVVYIVNAIPKEELKYPKTDLKKNKSKQKLDDLDGLKVKEEKVDEKVLQVFNDEIDKELKLIKETETKNKPDESQISVQKAKTKEDNIEEKLKDNIKEETVTNGETKEDKKKEEKLRSEKIEQEIKEEQKIYKPIIDLNEYQTDSYEKSGSLLSLPEELTSEENIEINNLFENGNSKRKDESFKKNPEV